MPNILRRTLPVFNSADVGRDRVEEALVAVAVAAGELVHRSPSTPPAAVLDVKVADKISRAALYNAPLGG